MRIAILAYYFRPAEAVGAIRPENWAFWLSEEHEVYVVSRELPGADTWEEGKYTVIRPKSFLIRWLEKVNKWRKKRRFFNTKDILNDTNKKEKINKTVFPAPNRGIFKYRMPCLHDVWFLSAYAALRQVKPDVVIATHNPYISLVVASAYSIFHSATRLWLDFRDLWTKNHRAVGLPPFSWLENFIECHAIKKAALVTTVSRGLANQIGCYPEKKYTIYNSPLLLPKFKKRQRVASNQLSFCYTGTIYIGWRDPTPLFKIMREALDEGCRRIGELKFIVASRVPGNLRELALSYGVSDCVDFKGSVPRQQAIQLQQDADVLVLLESPAPEARGVLTGKVFEYLATDKPILLIGPDESSELYQLLDTHGRLISLDYIKEVIRGNRNLPNCDPVDYSIIAKEQLFNGIKMLDKRKNGS